VLAVVAIALVAAGVGGFVALRSAGEGGQDAGLGDRPILVAAGDIASCGSGAVQATAKLVASIAGTIQTLGDNAYPDGSMKDFRDCYDPTWGRFLARTRPAAGNHDWTTPGAAGYLAYFGARAGTAGRTWYSYELGTWHIIVLDADCAQVGGCDPTSAQGRWLAADLAGHPSTCSLAVWHQPRFSSGETGNAVETAPLWDAFYAAGGDVVLSGHDHDYERFAPQAPDGRLDPGRGIREFVVGTGGGQEDPFLHPAPNSELRWSGVPGVLVLDLEPGRYSWRFAAIPGKTFTDAGSDTCH
jgi:acid phosphatase type 7